MQRADQAGIIGMKTDRHQVDLEVFGLENDVGAGNGELADPALPETAADHDAFGIRPGLGLEKFSGHMRQFLRKLLDRAMHQCRSMDIVADQRLVEFALGDLLGGFFPQGIVAVFLQRLAQGVQNCAKRPLAGAIAEKAVVVLQLDVETVDLHRRQPGGAVTGDARSRDGIFCHVAPTLPDFAGTTGREPFGFRRGEWRVANSEWERALPYSSRAIRHSPFSGQILRFRSVLSRLFLDSWLSAAISPGIRRGISRAACFCAILRGSPPTRAKIVPITTDQKADPDKPCMGICPRPGSNTKE